MRMRGWLSFYRRYAVDDDDRDFVAYDDDDEIAIYVPMSPAYTENSSGQYFFDWINWDDKRGPFNDAVPEWHDPQYNRYHKSKYFCSTCHDVSNPVLANLSGDDDDDDDYDRDFAASDDDDDDVRLLTTEKYPAYSYYHVERTFSEFRLSDYGKEVGGAPGEGPFAPGNFKTSRPDNYIATCQDCHLRDIVGAAAEDEFAKIRPTDSAAHPQSGQPLHDMTGGGAWVSYILASAMAPPDSPDHDPDNARLLYDRADVLTMDLKTGTLESEEERARTSKALMAGTDRAKQELRKAAGIENLTVDAEEKRLSFEVRNYTGHKLISGYPEGRRMFLNIKVWDKDGNLYEVNPYDYAAGTLKGLNATYKDTDEDNKLPSPAQLADTEAHEEAYLDPLVYEAKTSSRLTGETTTFHFVLATNLYKDNRIPPKGFNIYKASARQSVPHYSGRAQKDWFTEDEYAQGMDRVTLEVPIIPHQVEVNLYYQTTSREYVEFLRDELRGEGTLPSKSKLNPAWYGYIVQQDEFFDGLRAWGDTIWDLWKHNMNVDGGRPFLMAQATTEAPATLSPPTGLAVGLKATEVEGTLSYVVTEIAQDNDQYFCYTVSAYQGLEDEEKVVSPPATSQDMCIRIAADPEAKVQVYVSWDKHAEADGYRVQYYQGFVAADEEPEYGDAKLQLIARVE